MQIFEESCPEGFNVTLLNTLVAKVISKERIKLVILHHWINSSTLLNVKCQYLLSIQRSGG